MWSELPNYRPIGVTNATGGQDFEENAVKIFNGQSISAVDDKDEGDSPKEDEEKSEVESGLDKRDSSPTWDIETRSPVSLSKNRVMRTSSSRMSLY